MLKIIEHVHEYEDWTWEWPEGRTFPPALTEEEKVKYKTTERSHYYAVSVADESIDQRDGSKEPELWGGSWQINGTTLYVGGVEDVDGLVELLTKVRAEIVAEAEKDDKK